MAPGFDSTDLFRMIGSFALVLAIMAGLLWTLRKLQSRLNSQNAGKRRRCLLRMRHLPRQRSHQGRFALCGAARFQGVIKRAHAWVSL